MPICMSKEQWERIVKWTDPNKEDAAAIRRRELVEHMDRVSREMTKEWPNSLENVNKRNEEVRRARTEAAERANAHFYQKYVRRKQHEQQKLMHSARDTVFKNKDAPKLLLSAVIESATQKERGLQREFNQMLRDQAAEKKRKEDEETMNGAKQWHELQATKQKRRWEVNKKHQQEILQQAQEVAERNRKEYEKELNCQKIDNQRAGEEMALIKDYEEKLKAEEKKRILQSMEQAHGELVARRQESEARDKMDDRLIEVLTRSKCRTEQMRRDTEQRLKAEKLRILEAISSKLVSTDEERAAREQRSLDKALRDKEEAEKKREQEELEKKSRLVSERQQQNQVFLQEQQQRLHDLHTMQRWQMINRFKNGEIYEEYMQKQQDDKTKKIQEYRNEILRLWKEREDRDAAEKAETRLFYGKMAEQKLRHADNKLLTYADQLVQEAVRMGRPPLAIYKAIDRYCKMYRLYPMPELYKSLQEHFASYAPRDLSRPDPEYSEPAPPQRRAARTDGLQDAQPAAAAPRAPQPADLQHRRAAPANGLQQRNEIQYVLPPITAIPCELVQATPYLEVTEAQCRCVEDEKYGKSPKEKTSREKSPKEKAYRDKTPKEKASKEKSPNEKSPKEKTPKAESPNENNSKEKTCKEKSTDEKTPKG